MNQPGIKDVLGSEPKLIKEPAKFNGPFSHFFSESHFMSKDK